MIKGLYVHIPFCKNICGYCDFAKCRYSPFLADQYLRALASEIDHISQRKVESIYIGGGTPSALSVEQLQKLLEMLAVFEVEKEYTIELNPETFSFEKAQLIKQYGINRVSIGVQTFNEPLLKQMGRQHDNEDVNNTMKCLDEVDIHNRSIDLMFGFQGQTLAMVLQDLQQAVHMDITHISVYDLELYPNTLFGIQHYQKCDEELTELMYQTIVDFLNEHSYLQYETSNFALTKYQSHHNKLYWQYEDFLGVGLSASSKVGHVRYDNTKNFVQYLKGNYRAQETVLSDQDVRFEAIMMNLRMNEGIDVNRFNRRFDCDLLQYYKHPIQKNMERNLLTLQDGYLKTTAKGIFVLNDILVDFMD